MRPSLLFFSFFIYSAITAQVLVKNTNVLAVENKKVLIGYDVVVLDGRIVSVEKGKQYKLPPGTEVLDGTGKYLIPGFSDAHVHFFQSEVYLPGPMPLTSGNTSRIIKRYNGCMIIWKISCTVTSQQVSLP
ncbi:MAG: hypothetical protein SGI83_08110 [Bacteroidota bacterium]|nr:hypothetical protein [Bacteroidota bacterium]